MYFLGAGDLTDNTDVYFTKTADIFEQADSDPLTRMVVFVRKDTIAALQPALQYIIDNLAPYFDRIWVQEEGTVVPAKTPLLVYEGPLSLLAELETQVNQHVGWTCACAAKAREMVLVRDELAPTVKLFDFSARHVLPGGLPTQLTSYAAHLAGFDGCSTKIAAELWDGQPVGTMPHLLVGAAGSTLKAAKMYLQRFPNESVVILPDYYGREITDSTQCLSAYGSLIKGIRLDTPGDRLSEGATTTGEKIEMLRKQYPKVPSLRELLDKYPHEYICGPGVTMESTLLVAAAVKNDFPWVKLGVSSGFDVNKTRAFLEANIPIDFIGTGSFLPNDIRSTYATTDAIAYNNQSTVKAGRDWLIAAVEQQLASGKLIRQA